MIYLPRDLLVFQKTTDLCGRALESDGKLLLARLGVVGRSDNREAQIQKQRKNKRAGRYEEIEVDRPTHSRIDLSVASSAIG